MSSQPEREQIIAEMVESLSHVLCAPDARLRELAEACLAVIERANSSATETLNPCTCGQNGYPPNSPYSNHPHLPGCPHYTDPPKGVTE